MHFSTLVVIDPQDVDVTNRGDVEQHCEDVLARYDENREGEGQRYHLPDEEVAIMADALEVLLPAPDAPPPMRTVHPGGVRAQLAARAGATTVAGTRPDRSAALATLARRMEEWRGTEGGVDDAGLWAIDYSNPEGQWDWWVIGGRWCGTLDGYDPTADERNQQTCSICHGTGTRPDADTFDADWHGANNGCNGCQGTGREVKWSSEWEAHPGDVARIGDLLDRAGDEWVPHALVTHDGEWYASDCGWFEHDGGAWAARVRALLNADREKYVVMVDCHT